MIGSAGARVAAGGLVLALAGCASAPPASPTASRSAPPTPAAVTVRPSTPSPSPLPTPRRTLTAFEIPGRWAARLTLSSDSAATGRFRSPGVFRVYYDCVGLGRFRIVMTAGDPEGTGVISSDGEYPCGQATWETHMDFPGRIDVEIIPPDDADMEWRVVFATRKRAGE